MNSRTLTILLLLLALPALGAPTADDLRFKQAYAAAKAGGKSPSPKGLGEHLLFPYLQYESLRQRLASLPVAEVEGFLAANKGTYLEARLLDAWLRQLGRLNQWALYDRFYRPSTDGDLACISLLAQWKLGKLTAMTRAARLLWLTSRPQSGACDPVFEALRETGLLDQQLTLERFWLAVRDNRGQFAAHLLHAYAGGDAAFKQRVDALARRPREAGGLPVLPSESALNRALTGFAVAQLAPHDAERARSLWLSRTQGPHYTLAERAAVARLLAIHAVAQRAPSALAALDDVPSTDEDEQLEGIRLREALRLADWQRVLRWTSGKGATPASGLRLAYWRARAQDALGQAEEAKAGFTALAAQRDYYGFLAADRLGAKYALNDRPIRPDTREVKGVQAVLGIRRARAFESLGFTDEAGREWQWSVNQLSRREVEVAARLAQDWGWNDRAIWALTRIEAYDDLEIRFPVMFKASVAEAARETDLSPARIFGIIRLESAFMVNARSPVGALGLMQLMPATGKETARRLGLRVRKPNELLDPELNIRLGSNYLRQVVRLFDDNFALAAAAYNAGPSRVKSWLPARGCQAADLWVDTIPFAETEAYVRRALYYSAIYEYRLGLPMKSLREHLVAVNPDGPQSHEC